MKYKLRAECTQDVINFLGVAYIQMSSFSMTLDENNIDCELVFESECTLELFIELLKSVEDGHVMLETIQEIAKYTGIRDDTR